jgi:hypothetical protein
VDNPKQNDKRKKVTWLYCRGKITKFTAGYGGLMSWSNGGVGVEEVDIRIEEIVIIIFLSCLI